MEARPPQLAIPPRTFSGFYTLSVVDLLCARGVDEAALVSAIGTSRAALERPATRVAEADVLALFALGEAELDDPLVGLETGFGFRVARAGQTGSVLAHARSLREAAQTNSRYSPLMLTTGRSEFVETSLEGERAWALRYTPESPDVDAHRHITELVLGGYATTVRWLGWAMDWAIPAVRLRNAPASTPASALDPQGPAARYRRVFQCEPEFGALHNEVVLPMGAVDVELPTSAPQTFAALTRRLDAVLFPETGKRNARGVRRAIADGLAEGRTTRAAVAADMGISKGELDRRLTGGPGFRALLDEVRRERFDTLSVHGTNLADIAVELGYNDQAALTRAFRRWHGTTPGRHLSAL